MPAVHWDGRNLRIQPAVPIGGVVWATAPNPDAQQGQGPPAACPTAHGPGMMNQYPKSDAPPPYGMNPGMHPQMQPQMQPVAAVVVSPALGPTPANITCPSCHAQIQTRVNYESSTKTHIIALLLCVFGCWPCVCLPYCMDSCQTANHHCPSCGNFLGSFSN